MAFGQGRRRRTLSRVREAAHTRSAHLLAVAIVGALAGLALGGAGAIVPVVVVVAGASLLALGWKRLTVLLIGSTFVTYFRFNLLGANLRLEHLVLVACVVAMVAAGRERSLLAAAKDRTAMCFAAFVLWSALISALRAAKPAESLLIDGWLALDWVFLLVVLATWADARSLAGVAARWAGVAAAVAVALWVSATMAGTAFGVVTSDAERGTTASGLSFEPNLLGFTLAVWAFLTLTGVARLSGRMRTAVLALALVGLTLSLTRAAMIGLAGGVLVWAVLRGRVARRRVLRMAAATALVALIAVKLAPGASAPVARRASQVLDFGSGTGQLRVDSWRIALGDLHGVSWVVGLGSNSFGQRHIDPTQPGVPAYLGNLPLQILYDGGLVGVVLLGMTLISVVSRRRVRDGLGPGLITIYVACAAATSPFWYGTTWILVGIACLDRREGLRSPPPSPAEPPPLRSISVAPSAASKSMSMPVRN